VCAPWVVGGADRGAGEPRDALANQRALPPVAVATAAEDADETPGGDFPGLAKNILERLGSVRVVDEHGERLPLVHSLEPSRHAGDVLDTGRDLLRIDPEDARGFHRAEDVLDVEPATELRVDRDAVDDEPRAGRGELEVFRVREAERDGVFAEPAELVGQAAPV